MTSLSQTLSDNPVTRAEQNHQQRSPANHKWQRWPTIFGLGLGVGLLSNLGLALAPQFAALANVPVDELDELLRGWFGTITILLGGLVMIHHLSFSTAALQLAASSIAREKQGRTWDSLIMTGVDARRIIYGKGWATMRTIWRVYRPLLLLRFAVALWIGISGPLTRMIPFVHALPLLDVVLIGATAAVFPLCYAGFTVALGLLASLMVKSETAASRVASLFQFSIVVSLGMVLLSFMLPFNNVEPGLVALIPALFVTPMDGGMLALIGMIASTGSASLYYFVGLLLCIALYVALTWAVLRGALLLTIRQRALPPV